MCFRNEECISLTKARPYKGGFEKKFCGGGKFSKGSGKSTGDRFRSPASPGQSPCRGGGAEKPPGSRRVFCIIEAFPAATLKQFIDVINII